MSKKIKVFLSLAFLTSAVLTVAILFDFDFKKLFFKSKTFLYKNKEVTISDLSPIPASDLEPVKFLYLSEGSLRVSLPVRKKYFEDTEENISKHPSAISFKLDENEEAKAVFDGKIVEVEYVGRETIEDQANDFLRIWLENENETLVAVYSIVGDFLLEKNEEIKSGESLARVGRGIVPFSNGANFSLNIMKLEDGEYKAIALEEKMFLN
jgi:hypothetical protein